MKERVGDGIPNNSKHDCYSLNFDVVFTFAKAVSIILPLGQREPLALYVTHSTKLVFNYEFSQNAFHGFPHDRLETKNSFRQLLITASNIINGGNITHARNITRCGSIRHSGEPRRSC